MKVPNEATREFAGGLLGPASGFRLIVNGKIGVDELTLLIKYLELVKEAFDATDAPSEDVSTAPVID